MGVVGFGVVTVTGFFVVVITGFGVMMSQISDGLGVVCAGGFFVVVGGTSSGEGLLRSGIFGGDIDAITADVACLSARIAAACVWAGVWGLLVGAGAGLLVGAGAGLLVGAGAGLLVGAGAGLLVGAEAGLPVGAGAGLLTEEPPLSRISFTILHLAQI